MQTEMMETMSRGSNKAAGNPNKKIIVPLFEGAKI